MAANKYQFAMLNQNSEYTYYGPFTTGYLCSEGRYTICTETSVPMKLGEVVYEYPLQLNGSNGNMSVATIFKLQSPLFMVKNHISCFTNSFRYACVEMEIDRLGTNSHCIRAILYLDNTDVSHILKTKGEMDEFMHIQLEHPTVLNSVLEASTFHFCKNFTPLLVSSADNAKPVVDTKSQPDQMFGLTMTVGFSKDELTVGQLKYYGGRVLHIPAITLELGEMLDCHRITETKENVKFFSAYQLEKPVFLTVAFGSHFEYIPFQLIHVITNVNRMGLKPEFDMCLFRNKEDLMCCLNRNGEINDLPCIRIREPLFEPEENGYQVDGSKIVVRTIELCAEFNAQLQRKVDSTKSDDISFVKVRRMVEQFNALTCDQMIDTNVIVIGLSISFEYSTSCFNWFNCETHTIVVKDFGYGTHAMYNETNPKACLFVQAENGTYFALAQMKNVKLH